MHKSSKHSDNGCVCNEDAPTVVSCALFGYRSLWSPSTAGSFCVPPYRLDGKDTTMKGKGTKERKREFNRKYNSTLEERIKKTPKENTTRGNWTGDRGESW